MARIRNPLRTRGERTYSVWIKGKRIQTEERVCADTKDEAIWKFSKRANVKTIDCDAKWQR